MPDKMVHFEIHGKDGAQIQKFYASMFGWSVNADNPMHYGMVTDAGVGGGITASDMAPAVVIYVEVPDLDAALKKAEGLGATTVAPPMDVPGGPSIAQFHDPAGNVCGLIRAGSMGG